MASTTIHPALAPALQSLLQARYGPAQREECAGWRGVFEQREGDGALVATRDVEAGETVFLIDHLWCTTLLEARAQLTAHPVIRRNLQVVLGIDEESESDADDDEEEDESENAEEHNVSVHADGGEGEEDAMRTRLLAFLGIEAAEEAAARTEVDLDGVVEDPQQQPEPRFLSYILRTLPRLFPNVEALSLQSLGLGAGRAAEVKAMVQALPRLKALWLNGNGVGRALAADAELQGRLEIYNRRLPGSYSGWALQYLADGDEGEGPTKLDLAGRGLTALHAEAFAALPSLRWLDLSRNPQLPLRQNLLLPALQTLSQLESVRLDVIPGDEEEEERLARALPRLRWVNGRYITRVHPGANTTTTTTDSSVLLDDDNDDGQRTRRRAEVIDKVLMGVWGLAEPMRLAGPTDRHHAELHWCVLDVPGLALGHSNSTGGGGLANVALLHMRDRALGVTFTAAWPTRRIEKGERVARDYLDGFPPAAVEGVDPTRLVSHLCGPRRRRALQLEEAPAARGQDKEEKEGVGAEPAPAAKKEKEEEEEEQQQQQPVFPIEGGVSSLPRPLRVYTDMPVLRDNLGLPHYFAFTDDLADADIVWTAGAATTTHPLRNQWRGTLPNLGAVDDKCGMARLLSPRPSWLPRTFCLPEELPALLRYWEGVEEGGEEQLWILKPPHLARGWDIALATELPCVLRHLQASGRLSVSRYLPRPALWADGHKYDLRFYVLLLSPAQVLIHEHFRVRRAAQPYSLQRRHRHDLRRHLTNTTLGVGEENIEAEEEAGCPTETLHMDAFVGGFAGAHPKGPGWPAVRARIEGMLADCFGRLARAEGGLGNGEVDPCGRALLGVDVLLDGDTLAPFLLELNAAPNVIGICRERPGFWDEVFSAAFVRSEGAGKFRPLLNEA